MFITGKIYNRRRDIHDPFGGQRQGGISSPAGSPFVFIFTAQSGEQYGYSDGWKEEGVFYYTGEGQVGDQTLQRGNLAIHDHVKNGRDLHLFQSYSRGNYRYLGQMMVTGYHTRIAPDREGNLRQVIVFELIPFEDSDELEKEMGVELKQDLHQSSIEELRKRATRASSSNADTRQRVQNTYIRSEAIKEYALRRAEGKCEGCGKSAPFLKSDGSPYLEVHHIRRLSDGGPDDPEFVVALCPNCHRRAHYGEDAEDFNCYLEGVVHEIEGTL